jgi:phosphohistidine phosphatase
MRLLVVRHAIAEDRGRFAGDDEDRPLTAEGIRKMKKVAKGLSKLLGEKPSHLIVSPLVRAKQTAEVLRKSWPEKYWPEKCWAEVPVIISDFLRPEADVRDCLHWLTEEIEDEDALVVLVGHEPHLSKFVAWVMGGTKKSQIELKKGGACLLDVTPRRLLWLAPPSLLRSLG